MGNVRTQEDQARIEAIGAAEADGDTREALMLRESWCWREMALIASELERLVLRVPRDRQKEAALKVRYSEWDTKRAEYHRKWAALEVDAAWKEKQPGLFEGARVHRNFSQGMGDLFAGASDQPGIGRTTYENNSGRILPLE